MNQPSPALWRAKPQLSDEAAAQLLNFLHELLTGFENAYFDQLHRYNASRSPLSKEPPPSESDTSEDPF
jgi:hypothetical protein